MKAVFFANKSIPQNLTSLALGNTYILSGEQVHLPTVSYSRIKTYTPMRTVSKTRSLHFYR